MLHCFFPKNIKIQNQKREAILRIWTVNLARLKNAQNAKRSKA